MSAAGGPPTPYGQPPGGAHAPSGHGYPSGGGYPPPGYTQAPDGTYTQAPTGPPAGPFSHRRWAPPPYATSRTYASARGLATAVVVLLIVMAVLSLARLGAHAHRASILEDVRDGSIGFAQLGDVEDADGLVAGAALLWLLGMLATGVVFIVWQFRHTTNAEALRGHADGLGPGWSIGGWFIPFANLVLPGIQVFGASRPSDPALPPERPTGRGDGSSVVVAWAVLLGLASVVERVGGLNYPGDDSFRVDDALRDAISGDRVMAFGSFLYVVAAIVAAVMVHQLTTRQDQRAAVLAAAAGPGGSASPGHRWSPGAPPPPPGAGWAPPRAPSGPPGGPGSGAWPGHAGAPPPPPPHHRGPGSAPPPPPPNPWAPPGQSR